MTIYYSLIITASWLTFIVYWIVSGRNAKKNIGRRGWGPGFRIAVTIALVFVLNLPISQQFFSHFRYNDTAYAPISDGVGAILCVLGVGFAIWARRYLGRNWGMPMSLKENTELVTTGPYAYVRNPIYSGMLLAIFGTALATSAEWFVVFIFFLVYYIYSAKVEEGIMLEQFPNEYPAYKQRTKMLIPFVF